MKSEGGVVNEAFLEQHKRFHLSKDAEHCHLDSVKCVLYCLSLKQVGGVTGRISIPAFIQNYVQGRRVHTFRHCKQQFHVSRTLTLL